MGLFNFFKPEEDTDWGSKPQSKPYKGKRKRRRDNDLFDQGSANLPAKYKKPQTGVTGKKHAGGLSPYHPPRQNSREEPKQPQTNSYPYYGTPGKGMGPRGAATGGRFHGTGEVNTGKDNGPDIMDVILLPVYLIGAISQMGGPNVKRNLRKLKKRKARKQKKLEREQEKQDRQARSSRTSAGYVAPSKPTKKKRKKKLTPEEKKRQERQEIVKGVFDKEHKELKRNEEQLAAYRDHWDAGKNKKPPKPPDNNVYEDQKKLPPDRTKKLGSGQKWLPWPLGPK